MNILLDNNIIIDILSNVRNEKFQFSQKLYTKCLKDSSIKLFVSVASLDNLEFILAKEAKEVLLLSNRESFKLAQETIKNFLLNISIAKTPSYIDINYKDIEDSQIIASARAIGAVVITRDKGMLESYPNIAITAQYFLENQEKVNIDFANLKKQYFMYQSEIEEEMDKVLNNSDYIMGSAVSDLEVNLQNFTGVKYAITCSSGTDALLLVMMALDIKPDDEIITTPFTFIATAETIAFLGAKPVFVDIDEKTYNIDPTKIEEKITEKTKAIMSVSLYGQPSDMDAIQSIADKHNLKVIIDGAQSFGSTYKGKTDSNLGDISTTSFFPAKPLGCFGDGGVVFVNDEALAIKMKQLRVHGQDKRYHHKYIGMGGRLDTLQAAVLNVKLKYYKKDLALRQEVASKYSEALKDKELILPFVDENATSAWAQYSVRIKNRDEVQSKLKESGIPTAVHYPLPLHLQECFKYLGYKEGDFPIAELVSGEIMSLPMNPYLRGVEIEYVGANF